MLQVHSESKLLPLLFPFIVAMRNSLDIYFKIVVCQNLVVIYLQSLKGREDDKVTMGKGKAVKLNTRKYHRQQCEKKQFYICTRRNVHGLQQVVRF